MPEHPSGLLLLSPFASLRNWRAHLSLFFHTRRKTLTPFSCGIIARWAFCRQRCSKRILGKTPSHVENAYSGFPPRTRRVAEYWEADFDEAGAGKRNRTPDLLITSFACVILPPFNKPSFSFKNRSILCRELVRYAIEIYLTIY